MKKKFASIIRYFVVIYLLFSNCALAEWVGPQEVVSALWGKTAGQIGIEYGDTSDIYPRSFGISKSGKIVIADRINEVLHIFDSDGAFIRDLKKGTPWKGWPADVIVNGECAVVGYVEMTHTFNVLTGELIGLANQMDGADFISQNCSTIFTKINKIWKVYTPTGQILNNVTIPNELLGVQKSSRKQSDGNYLTIIEYPDMSFKVKTPFLSPKFIRDEQSNLFTIHQTGEGDETHYRVDKFNKCGKLIGYIDLPVDDITYSESEGYIEAAYGKPLITSNGDIYAYKYTPDKYSIVKWTWVDDANTPPPGPDAPTNLKVTPSTTGLYLTWTASPQDPGCVTGYEVSRSTTSGGIYSVITTVAKGILKYNDTTTVVGTTYYYKLRAVSGTDYSPYTSEASGKR